jgi:hypothetical protein
MRTQATAWYDTKNDKILHGVKVYAEGQWYNYSEEGRAVLFENEGAAERKRAELRRMKEFVIGRDGVRVGEPHAPNRVIRTAA